MVAPESIEADFDAELLALAAEIEDTFPEGEEWARIERTTRFGQMCDFLSTLFSPYEGRGFIELRAIKRGAPPTRYFLPVADATGEHADKSALKDLFRWAFRMNEEEGREIYCGVLPRCRRAGRKEDVAEGAWVWGDMDFKIGGKEDCFCRLEAAKIQPDMVVLSGGGIHVYWRLSEMVRLTEPQTVASFESAIKRFQQVVQPGSDPVQDISRVLRLAGFYNMKQKENPRLVALARVTFPENITAA